MNAHRAAPTDPPARDTHEELRMSVRSPDLVRHARARRALTWAMLVTPLTIVVAAVVVMFAAGGDPGREVIVHWGPDGADGWGPAWTYPVLLVAIGGVLPVLLWWMIARVSRVGGTAVFLAGLMIWLDAFLAVGLTASLLAQPDVIGWWFAIAFAAGLLLAAPAWLWLPREAPTASVPTELNPVDLAPGQVAVWSRPVLMSRAFIVVMVLVTVLALGATVFATIVTDGAAWISLFAPVIVAAALVLTLGWRVTVGPRGLTVRGFAGFPVFRVAIDDLASVTVVRIEPLADFGGWGIRGTLTPTGQGRTGIVVRAGAALEVTRRDGRQLVVTVDDATTGAAVLQAHQATSTPPTA